MSTGAEDTTLMGYRASITLLLHTHPPRLAEAVTQGRVLAAYRRPAGLHPCGWWWEWEDMSELVSHCPWPSPAWNSSQFEFLGSC